MAFEMPVPASIINRSEKRHFAVSATVMCRVAAANVVSGKCTLAPVEYSTQIFAVNTRFVDHTTLSRVSCVAKT